MRTRPKLTTQDVRVNGYPPLDVVLAFYDSVPALVRLVRQYAPDDLTVIEQARNSGRMPAAIEPVSSRAAALLEAEAEGA